MPAAPRARAKPRPRPEDAPVTSATLPSRDRTAISVYYARRMDTVTHGIAGSVFARTLTERPAARAALVLGLVGSMLPDIDILFQHDKIDYLRNHRGWTHSLLLLPLFALVLAVAARLVYRYARHIPLATLFLFSAIGIASHIAFDWITSFGTMFGLPFTRRRFALDWVFIVDPIFTARREDRVDDEHPVERESTPREREPEHGPEGSDPVEGDVRGDPDRRKEEEGGERNVAGIAVDEPRSDGEDERKEGKEQQRVSPAPVVAQVVDLVVLEKDVDVRQHGPHEPQHERRAGRGPLRQSAREDGPRDPVGHRIHAAGIINADGGPISRRQSRARDGGVLRPRPRLCPRSRRGRHEGLPRRPARERASRRRRRDREGRRRSRVPRRRRPDHALAVRPRGRDACPVQAARRPRQQRGGGIPRSAARAEAGRDLGDAGDGPARADLPLPGGSSCAAEERPGRHRQRLVLRGAGRLRGGNRLLR